MFLMLLSAPYWLKANSITPAEIKKRVTEFQVARRNPDEGITFYTEIDSLCRSINDLVGLFEINLNLSQMFQNGNMDKAWSSVKVLDSLYQMTPSFYSDSLVVKFLLQKVNLLDLRYDSIRALEMYLEADSICKTLNDDFLGALVNHNFTRYYHRNWEFEKALVYNSKCIEYYQKDTTNSQNKFYYLTLLNNAATIHVHLENYDSAIFYTDKAIKEGFAEFGQIELSYIILGRSYYKKDEIDNALYYANLTREALVSKTDFSNDRFENHLLFGSIYTAKNELDSAEFYLNSALFISDSIQFITGNSRARLELIRHGLKKHNCSHLFQHVERYNEIMKNKFDEKKEEKEKQLIVQYETAKKQEEIARLLIHNEQVQKRNLLILSLLIILFALFTFIIYRNRLRNKILAQQLENSQLGEELIQTKLNKSIQSIKDKNEIINELQILLSNQADTTENVEKMTNILGENNIDEAKWNEIIFHFDKLNANFSKVITEKYNEVSKNDIKLLILVRLGYLNKEISVIRNISTEGVKKAKQRLRKKLGVTSLEGI